MDLTPHNFYGDTMFSVKDERDGTIYVPLRPIIRNLGIDWKTQKRKIQANLNKWRPQIIEANASDGKLRKTTCLPLKKLPGWLFSINVNQVRPDLKEKIEQYQEECFQVLYDYWNKGLSINPKLIRTNEDIIAAVLDQTDKLLGAVRQNLTMVREQVKILQPKADYYDTCINKAGLKSIGEFARTLNGNIGRNRLFNYMKLDNLIFRAKSNGTWMPYQKYIDQGYLAYKIGVTPSGQEYGQIYITPKGELFVFRHLQYDGLIPKNAIYKYIDSSLEDNIAELDSIESKNKMLLSHQSNETKEIDIKIPRGTTIQ